jgi:hypothetical protein
LPCFLELSGLVSRGGDLASRHVEGAIGAWISGVEHRGEGIDAAWSCAELCGAVRSCAGLERAKRERSIETPRGSEGDDAKIEKQSSARSYRCTDPGLSSVVRKGIGSLRSTMEHRDPGEGGSWRACIRRILMIN